MRALIVDDEAPARRELRRLLAEHDDVVVVAEAADVASAARALENAAPDVVFLDIRLGRESGFDLLEHVDEGVDVVFVTAFSDHAVRAFETQAADYLLKPVEPARLRQTIERLRARAASASAADHAPGGSRGPAPASTTGDSGPRGWILVDEKDRPELIAVSRITHVVAEGSRSRIHTDDGRARSTGKGLADWERRLPAVDFVRVHRSTLVNLRHVERLEPWFHYGLRLYVRGGAEPIAVSRRRAAFLRAALG